MTLNAKDLTFVPSELRKQYKVGDHVKIRAGRDSGETGTIIKIDSSDVENQVAVIMSDLSKEQHVALCKHLQLTKEVAQGLRSLQGYHQYDLVRVGRNQVGVIVQVGREHLQVSYITIKQKYFSFFSNLLSQYNIQTRDHCEIKFYNVR